MKKWKLKKLSNQLGILNKIIEVIKINEFLNINWLLQYLLHINLIIQFFIKNFKKLNFQNITLKQNLDEAANDILLDKKHLDNNQKKVTKNEIKKLLKIINENKFDQIF